MVDLYDIADLQILDRYAKKEGYQGLGEYLPQLQAWNLSIPIAAECVRRGISFSDHMQDPKLIEEELPEGVVNIFDLYRAQEERIVMQRKQDLEERIVNPIRVVPRKKEHPLRTVFYGIVTAVAAASVLIGLSSFPQRNPPSVESSLIHDPLCTSIEGLYICSPQSDHGQFFGAYWQYKQQKEGN